MLAFLKQEHAVGLQTDGVFWFLQRNIHKLPWEDISIVVFEFMNRAYGQGYYFTNEYLSSVFDAVGRASFLASAVLWVLVMQSYNQKPSLQRNCDLVLLVKTKNMSRLVGQIGFSLTRLIGL